MKKPAILLSLLLPASIAFAEEPATLLPHSDASRFWFGAQYNEIVQEHSRFHAAYSGANSFLPNKERVASRLMTLYTGFETSRTSEILVDVERASGGGLSQALGVAGFTDLDVVRNPQLSHSPYLARLEWHQVIPLGSAWEKNERGPLCVLRELPADRIELRVGKISTVDQFDVNSIGSDSHLQFMNWSIDNNGAYDYAADTRGYTWGAIGELRRGWWSIRAEVALMPVVANGLRLDHDVRKDRGQNLELESRRSLVAGRNGVVRFLVYRNLARMGVYRDAIRIAQASGSTPDITADDRPGRAKTGLGVNIEQEVSNAVRLFARAGWNGGRTESFAYTEIDNTIAAGADTRIPHRPLDRAGIALVSNGISRDHRDYLAAGGLGFIIGDGALRYGREQIAEGYYTLHLGHGISIAGDLQWIRNPAYNRDRGPVVVRSLRLHVDL